MPYTSEDHIAIKESGLWQQIGRVLLEMREKSEYCTIQAVCEVLSEADNKPFHRSLISNIENGQRAISLPVLESLARIYGVSVSHIVLEAERLKNS